jgi:hypothetical protein
MKLHDIQVQMVPKRDLICKKKSPYYTSKRDLLYK